ncbi:MAG TPA: hypothetical protein ENK07_02690, partial [Bacteroidetes bacterium]|nr:hypothetical protein [Bacteroidota bacterium]
MSSKSQLNVGYAEGVITPPLGISLGGYGFYLDRPAERVVDDLKVRALALESGEDRALLVSVDLLGFTVDFSDQVRQSAASRWELSREQVLLACTHTHSGPQTQPMPGLGEVDTGYLQHVHEAAVVACEAAIRDLRPARAFVVVQAVEPIGYNRTTGDFSAIDPHLRTLTFDRGSDRVFLLNYACHPVTLGPTREVSADWPGALIHQLEEAGNRAIFFQG